MGAAAGGGACHAENLSDLSCIGRAGQPLSRIHIWCADCLREMDEYVWDLSGGGKDKVRKEHDHAMDDMRYFAATVLGERQEGISAWAVERGR